MVDADPFFSDQPISTHAIQPYGMMMLDRLGLGDVVRALAPRNTAFRFQVEDSHLQIELDGKRLDSRSPRRCKLDPALQKAVLEAGVDARERTRVVELLRDGENVAGVRVGGPQGEYELRAPLIVGADGRNSTIAKLVGAPAYLESSNHNAIYWTYFEKTPLFDEDPRYRWGACIHIEGREARAVFQTDSDLVLMGGGGSREVVDAWRSDPAAGLTEHLGRGRLTAPLLEGSRMVSKPLGVLAMHFFMKQAVGPGWALVGDAGLHLDPTPGLGITDAVRDAVALSEAIVDGGERALHLYWRRRDADSLGLFYFAGDMGSPEYNNAFTRMLFDRGQADPVIADRMGKMMTREIRPQEMLPPLRVLRWLLAETFSGRLGPLRAAGRMARLRTLIDRQQIAVDRALERAESGVLDWTPPALLNN